MTGVHPPSRAANRSKRKHLSSNEEQSQSQSQSQCSNSHTKRRRVASSSSSSKPKTLTTIPDPPTTNQFQHLHSSSRSRRKHRDTKSNATEPSNRKWVFSSRDCSSYQDKVVVVSYNILGVENASKHPNLYYNVPRKFLDWDRRKSLIRKEINHYNASILCFQEVDRFDDLEDLYRKDGFVGIYKARTGEACDGCAIFWKDKLSAPTQSRRLLVGNIHVLFNPNRGDIKLGQVRLFLEKAYELSQEWGNIPVIIGGDLNSKPQSAIYQFLASSKLDTQLHDRRKISGQLEGRDFRPQNENTARWNVLISIPRPLLYRWSDEELRLATGCGGVTHVEHQLKLCSAYLGVPGSSRTRDNHGEPLATSYHSKFLGTVDYIWHTEELVPVRVLETLPIDILRRNGGLPSEKWGSDHLALVCELAFADDVKGT
uniref:Endonuclease/exonuclease/phosphatase domain-containing protein n=1 Tax=Fagus sylvatica TaxID=28930 RepID=A0A2N9GZD6_FAGSY